MMTADEDKKIDVATLGISNAFTVQNEGGQLMLYASPQVRQDAIARQRNALVKQQDGQFTVLDANARRALNASRVERFGDILLQAVPPHRFSSKDYTYFSPGAHGYSPDLPDMQGIFIASGPAFASNMTLPALSNLEIYPALAKIMGLPLLNTIDGQIEVLKPALK
mgnify:CR=1 FL=1